MERENKKTGVPIWLLLILAFISAVLVAFFGIKEIFLPFYLNGWLGLCLILNFTLLPLCLAVAKDKTGFMQKFEKALHGIGIFSIICSTAIITVAIVVFSGLQL